MACRATLRLTETLEQIQLDLESVEDMQTSPKLLDSHTEKELQKIKVSVYVKGGLEVTKLYAPSILVAGVAITALTGAHVQLSRRNAALMAAYAAVQEAYDNYRERVRAQLGEERELEIYHAVETEVVKDGNKKTELKVADPNKWSPYAKMFDEYNKNWERDPELNRLFIQCQQNYANHQLQSRGHIFLNEIYDSLGFDRTTAGQVVGWVIGDDGDNYIDFGMWQASSSRFVNGDEPSVILDFNVDGVIYDKI
jgi:hypothetical protein